MRGLRSLRAGLLGVLLVSPAFADETALDRYVKTPDPNYRYELLSTFTGDGYTAFVLEMTSQEWRSTGEVDKPIWKHWLTIVEPKHVQTRTGVLIISGGSNNKGPPGEINRELASLATETGSVVSEIRMVPNQPLTFADEKTARTEDAVAAYSWDKYLATGDETWPLHLAMTKAAVRAMDTVTAFCWSWPGGRELVDRFVVGGASKRGWTAWMTAAADKRVVAVVPLVIDMLNMEPSFEHHYRAYGFWAPALHEYDEMGIMRWRGSPQFDALMAIEDPYAYRGRLTMPKFIINSTGDQFFAPDSSQFYFEGLSGEKYLRYVPNTNHSLKGSDARESAIAFYESVISGAPRPKFTWRFDPDGSIRVKTEAKPMEVKLWQAANPKARDFRLQTIGPAFKSSTLEDEGGGVYIGRVPKPEQGWIAYFVELTYRSGGRHALKFTTAVRVVPDVLPYDSPPKSDRAEGTDAGNGLPPARIAR